MNITWSKNNVPVITLNNDTYFNFGSDANIKWIVVGGKVNCGGFVTTERSLIPAKLTLASIPNNIKKNIDKVAVKKISKAIRKYIDKNGSINRKHLVSVIKEIEK